MTLRFGTAGVRGVYRRELSPKNMLQFMVALSKVFGGGYYGIGYDTRKTSNILMNVAESVLMWMGHKTIDLGLAPTPVIAFAAKYLRLEVAIAITASHNPPQYVGVKVFTGDGLEVSKELEAKIERNLGITSPHPQYYGNIMKKHVLDDYLDKVLQMVPRTKRKLRILVDCANGVGSTVTPYLLERLGHKVITINTHPSWEFPGRDIEPKAETLVETAEIVKRLGVDIGFAHDGDADRLVIIDKSGYVVPDHFFSAMMLKIITRERSGIVVLSSNSSLAVEEVADRMGCRIIRAPLGKTPHKLTIRNGVYATEPSKIVDPRWGLWEDGIYAAVVLAQEISNLNKGLFEVMESIPRYHYVQKDLVGYLLSKDALPKIVKRHYDKQGLERYEEIDGTRVVMADEWIMFRCSGTEQKIRIYAEAKRKERALELIREGEKVLTPYINKISSN